MKKVILACAFSAFYLASFAQVDTPRQQVDTPRTQDYPYGHDQKNMKQDQKNMNGQSQRRDTMNKDCTVKMMNGQVMRMTPDGRTMALSKDTTLKNGTVVMTDGTVKMKDGKIVYMREGECMNQSGKMKKMSPMQEGTK